MIGSKKTHEAIFTGLYLLATIVFLYIAWRYDQYVVSDLKNQNTLILSFQGGVLLEFLILTGLRVLGGMVLALPALAGSYAHARRVDAPIRITWSIRTLLVIPLLFPVLFPEWGIHISPNWFLFLINGYTRQFCSIALGYLLMPQIKEGRRNKESDVPRNEIIKVKSVEPVCHTLTRQQVKR